MELQEIVSLFVNNGVAVGLLCYFVYRDNKFMNSLNVTLKSLQTSVESVKNMLERRNNSDEGD